MIIKQDKQASAGPAKAHPDKTFRRLLDELHAKRSWLDALILSLEAALDSPERRLVEATEKALADNPNIPLVDLSSEQQSVLARLAQDVRSGSRRSEE